MNNKGIAILPIVVIVAGLLAFGVTGYFFYSTIKNSNESADTGVGLVNSNTNRTFVTNGNTNGAVNTNTVVNVNGNTNSNDPFSASCTVDTDCILDSCTGCYKQGSHDSYGGASLPCMMYGVGYTCSCANKTCTTVKISDVTKDWKTYTNSIEGYTIKYPPTWTYKEVNDLNAVQFTKTGSQDIVQPSINVRSSITLEQLQQELRDNMSTIGAKQSRAIIGRKVDGFVYTGAIGADYVDYLLTVNSKSYVFYSADGDSDWQLAMNTFTLTK